jgi:hypothetical protein
MFDTQTAAMNEALSGSPAPNWMPKYQRLRYSVDDRSHHDPLRAPAVFVSAPEPAFYYSVADEEHQRTYQEPQG